MHPQRSLVRTPSARVAHAVAAAGAAGALVAVVLGTGATWWQAAAVWALPDIPLLFGMGPGMARGRLHPRAVPAYNALHTWWGPAGLAVLTAALGTPAPALAATAAWAFHIALDRAAGYGLRTPAGYLRGA